MLYNFVCMKKQRTLPVYFNFKKPNYNLGSVKNKVAADRPNILANNTVSQANLNNMAQAVTVRSQPTKFNGLPSENAQGWLINLKRTVQ